MSVLGRKTAIVSLGSSCQTAHQIKQNARLLSDLTGDALMPRRLPFDWLICPPGRMAEWIEANDPFPAEMAELSPYRQDGTFHWRRRGLFFWHDFKHRKESDLPGIFEPTREKYVNLFKLFHGLENLEKVVFLVSNTQNNLEDVLGEDFRSGAFSFTTENTGMLKAAIEGKVGRNCDLLCVAYDDRCAPNLPDDPQEGVSVAHIPKDASEWKGDDEVWRGVLERYFGSRRI